MLRKFTMVLSISAALAALMTEPSAARHWRGGGADWLPGWGLRYGWGVYGRGYYGFEVPYHGDAGYDYYGSAYPSDFVPRHPSECGDGCPTYRVTVRGARW